MHLLYTCFEATAIYLSSERREREKEKTNIYQSRMKKREKERLIDGCDGEWDPMQCRNAKDSLCSPKL